MDLQEVITNGKLEKVDLTHGGFLLVIYKDRCYISKYSGQTGTLDNLDSLVQEGKRLYKEKF